MNEHLLKRYIVATKQCSQFNNERKVIFIPLTNDFKERFNKYTDWQNKENVSFYRQTNKNNSLKFL